MGNEQFIKTKRNYRLRAGVATSAGQYFGDSTAGSIFERCETHLREYGLTPNPGAGGKENWESDFLWLQESGFNGIKIGVDWADIQQEPKGQLMNPALELFNKNVNWLSNNHMLDNSMITLHHFDNPQWLLHQGGWLNPRSAEWFADYTIKVLESIQDVAGGYKPLKIELFNEPATMIVGEIMGIFYAQNSQFHHFDQPPVFNVISDGAFPVFSNMRKAMKLIKEESKKRGWENKFSFGIGHQLVPLLPENKKNHLLTTFCGINEGLLNEWVMARFGDLCDFLDVRYYRPETMKIGVKAAAMPLSDYAHQGFADPTGIFLKSAGLSEPGADFHWELKPELMFDTLLDLRKKYPHLELVVGEFGFPGNDPLMARYMVEAIASIYKFNDWITAMNQYDEGAKVKNMKTVKNMDWWTLVPCFEWFNPPEKARFSLLDKHRKPRKIAMLYQAINLRDKAMANKALQKIFPTDEKEIEVEMLTDPATLKAACVNFPQEDLLEGIDMSSYGPVDLSSDLSWLPLDVRTRIVSKANALWRKSLLNRIDFICDEETHVPVESLTMSGVKPSAIAYVAQGLTGVARRLGNHGIFASYAA